MEFALFVFFSVSAFVIGYNVGSCSGYEQGVRDYREQIEKVSHIRY